MSEYKITAVVETTIAYWVSADSEEEAREMAEDCVPDVTEWGSASLGGYYCSEIEEVEEIEE